MPTRASVPNTQQEGPQPALFDTSVEVWRYLLIIRPSAVVGAEVGRMKKAMAEHIGPFKNQGALAHITLLFAYVPRVHERDMCEGISQGVKGQSPFRLHLRGFGHFPDKRTIHLEVVEKEPIIRLRRNILAHLRAYARLKGLGIHPTTAERLILAKLSPGQFDTAWSNLEQGWEHGERVDALVLLRGDQRPSGPYEEVAVFPLVG